MSRTISNMYTYPFNPQLLIKTQVESHDKNQKIKGTFITFVLGPLFFKWVGVFQSLLDCFPVGV